jgi:hypothetical protein
MEQETTKQRLQRILRRCGWTIHLRKTPSGCYAGAAKRGPDGAWNWQYIGALPKIDAMETGQIVAVLPPVA